MNISKVNMIFLKISINMFIKHKGNRAGNEFSELHATFTLS